MTKLHQYGIMSAPTMSQYAAIEALKNGDDDIAEMRDQYDMRRRLIVDGLNRLGLTCFEPEGAFYVFPSIQSTGMTSDEFCEQSHLRPSTSRWCRARHSVRAARALYAFRMRIPSSTLQRR